MTTPEEQDKRANEILVTGALYALLSLSRDDAAEGASRIDVVSVDGQATNELYLWLPFMKSRYRVTVTFDPEDDDGG